MIGLGFVYALMGLLTGAVAVANARDRAHPRRWRAAAFWGLWSLTFLAGPRLGDVGAGLVVVALGLLAGAGGGFARPAGTPQAEAPEAGMSGASTRDVRAVEGGAVGSALGNRLFVPALLVPAVTVAGTWAYKRVAVGGRPLVDPKQATLVALGTGALAGLAAALLLLRPGAVGAVVGRVVPLGLPLAAAAAYTLGMALLTAALGNAFAAFPVMTLAVGLPVLVGRFGADPAAVAALGMLSGFCGTLCTPMAANFNTVPAALLDLPGAGAVIRVQAPTALALLAANTVLLYAVVHHAAARH